MHFNVKVLIVIYFLGVITGAFSIYLYKNFSKSPEVKSASSYLKFKEIKESFLPKGIPEVYGEELKISFDEVQDAIDKVKRFDPYYGKEKIELHENERERYVRIGLETACKYCCGARTLVFEDGKPACGCAHSQMMRGLLSYLIKNHPEFSDKQILEELNKWRRVFFPKQTLSEKLQQMKESGDSDIEDILQEFPEFLPEMVGGC